MFSFFLDIWIETWTEINFFLNEQANTNVEGTYYRLSKFWTALQTIFYISCIFSIEKSCQNIQAHEEPKQAAIKWQQQSYLVIHAVHIGRIISHRLLPLWRIESETIEQFWIHVAERLGQP